MGRAPGVLGEHAHARQLFDAGVDGGIVVISCLALELFRAERHVVVEVEVVAEGRAPGKAPAHAPLEGGNPLVGRARDGYERKVRVLEVLPRRIDMVGLEGAAGATLLDRQSTRPNSSHHCASRTPFSSRKK